MGRIVDIYTITKEKTNIRGFWQDNNGKVYIDSIKKVSYSNNLKDNLFLSGELAVFYCDDNTAYIESKNGCIDVLRVKRVLHYQSINVSLIKELLANFNGITVYRNKTFNDYTIEIWQ